MAVSAREREPKTGSSIGRRGVAVVTALGLGLGLGIAEAATAKENTKLVPVKHLRSLGSLVAARSLICDTVDKSCEIDTVDFRVRDLTDGHKRASVVVHTRAGLIPMNLRTVVADVFGGNNYHFVSPHNSRLGFNIDAVDGREDAVSVFFSPKSLVKGTGEEVGLAGAIRSRNSGRYAENYVVASVDGGSGVLDRYNPPLTHKVDAVVLDGLAQLYNLRFLVGKNAEPFVGTN